MQLDQRILIILQLIVVMDSLYVYRDNNVTRDGFFFYIDIRVCACKILNVISVL
jgi:hypothetical protein